MNINANFIGGVWTRAIDARPNINPSNTGDIVGYYAEATTEDVKGAAEAARNIASSWATAALGTRALLLQKVADLIDSHRAELALLLSREEGKALRDATA